MPRIWIPLLAVALVGCKRPRPPAPASEAPPADIPAPADLQTPPADAQRTASGLASKVLRAGTGQEHPQPQDMVEVHYTGWGADGRMFDSSVPSNAPSQFEVGSAIKGWSEGIALMVAGEKRRLWIPAALAYGDRPHGRAPAGPLVFDVELLKVVKRPAPLPAPADVAHPPADARRTRSGVAYKTLLKGSGARHPRRDELVEVNYTSWTSAGKMIDSTVVHGQPSTFRADGLGPAWGDAMVTMVAGEKARFWFPAALAGWGGPEPMVVYDVELRAIK
jgi:FKBP-type peptidyl-prolyl cis-trans isomerase